MTESVYGITIPEDLSWSTSFQEWIKQWNAATDVPTAIGLLHNIFRASEGEESGHRKYDDHRVLFLLKLADGHRVNGRSGLAHKAFSVLAHEFFHNANPERIKYLSQEVIGALLNFFNNEDIGTSWYQNVRWDDADAQQSSHVSRADQLASRYLRLFCDVAWSAHGDEVRVRIVDLLASFDKLEVLVPTRAGLAWDRFTEPVMQKLEEVGMQPESTHHGYASATPSLEELVYHGSPAARALLLIRIGRQGQAKEKRLKELKAQAAQAAAELEKLQT